MSHFDKENSASKEEQTRNEFSHLIKKSMKL